MEKYKLSIFGKGGHGAEPNEAIDTTIIASEFVRKSTKYKNIEIISVNSGTSFNVISGKAEIILETDNLNKIKHLIEAILVYYGEETTYDLTCL